jgi:hypothetical protein
MRFERLVFANPDKIGKVCGVLGETMRLRLICDEAFTRQGAVCVCDATTRITKTNRTARDRYRFDEAAESGSVANWYRLRMER